MTPYHNIRHNHGINNNTADHPHGELKKQYRRQIVSALSNVIDPEKWAVSALEDPEKWGKPMVLNKYRHSALESLSGSMLTHHRTTQYVQS